MARIAGQERRRFGPESIRLATAVAALVLAVLFVFAAQRLLAAGVSTVATVALTTVLLAVLVPAKLWADYRMVGGARGRRAEDTRLLAEELSRLPDSWTVLPDAMLAGAAVEFLVVGPGGVFAVEVYRWLTRDTGTAFPEKMAAELAARAAEVGRALGQLTGSGPVQVQPVFYSIHEEGLALGDLVVHPAAPDLRHLRGVLLTTRPGLLPLLRHGGPGHGVGTHRMEPERAQRLAGFLQSRLKG